MDSGEDMGRLQSENRCVIVAGPTASGKSALALSLAERFDGVVINADSMQVYDGLAVITAQPTPEDHARAPHALYGTVAPSIRYSAAQWAEVAAESAQAAWRDGRLPVVCGGTGFYLETLMRGLSPMPDIPGEVRAAVGTRRDSLSPAKFHAELASVDPISAARLNPADGQRIARALEVFEATGRPMADWIADQPPRPALEAAYLTMVLMPDRDDLYAGIDSRFETMIDAGALREVQALLERGLDATLPAMKALGVPELTAHLSGAMALDKAVLSAQRKSRNYAKRQVTWLRGRLAADPPNVHWVSAKYSESVKQYFFSIIREFLLTGQG